MVKARIVTHVLVLWRNSGSIEVETVLLREGDILGRRYELPYAGAIDPTLLGDIRPVLLAAQKFLSSSLGSVVRFHNLSARYSTFKMRHKNEYFVFHVMEHDGLFVDRRIESCIIRGRTVAETPEWKSLDFLIPKREGSPAAPNLIDAHRRGLRIALRKKLFL